MIVPGMFASSSFLMSVCMFIVSKASLISSATVIVRAGGAIWLNPFATVLFSVCSAVTVEYCVLYPCCMVVFRCRRCDGTIQEVDLAEDLMVDGETYECVKSVC